MGVELRISVGKVIWTVLPHPLQLNHSVGGGGVQDRNWQETAP